MTFKQPELNLTDPTKGYSNFVLYAEPSNGAVGTALNAVVRIENESRYGREWLERLQRCEPNPLHTTLVDNQDIPTLFHPCVDEDEQSESAVAGSGCVCHQTWSDPEFGLPVVGKHFRTVGGGTDRWTYLTFAPLDLRPHDNFASLIIDGSSSLFWIRTAAGILSLLPQLEGRGYGVGYGGGGPSAFADYLHRLVDSDGSDTAAGRLPPGQSTDPQILKWAMSPDTKRTQELTLKDLKSIQRG